MEDPKSQKRKKEKGYEKNTHKSHKYEKSVDLSTRTKNIRRILKINEIRLEFEDLKKQSSYRDGWSVRGGHFTMLPTPITRTNALILER